MNIKMDLPPKYDQIVAQQPVLIKDNNQPNTNSNSKILHIICNDIICCPCVVSNDVCGCCDRTHILPVFSEDKCIQGCILRNICTLLCPIWYIPNMLTCYTYSPIQQEQQEQNYNEEYPCSPCCCYARDGGCCHENTQICNGSFYRIY